MNEGKVVDAARGRALADEFDMLFFEASANDNINVEESFVAIARDIKMRLLGNAADAAPVDVSASANVARADAQVSFDSNFFFSFF